PGYPGRFLWTAEEEQLDTWNYPDECCRILCLGLHPLYRRHLHDLANVRNYKSDTCIACARHRHNAYSQNIQKKILCPYYSSAMRIRCGNNVRGRYHEP